MSISAQQFPVVFAHELFDFAQVKVIELVGAFFPAFDECEM